MAETIQHSFDLKEVGELLIKKAGLTSGFWQIGVTFGFGAHTMGPSPEEMKPSAVIGVLAIVLLKADKPGPLILDAAEVNVAGGEKSGSNKAA
jgi:hypothetical protein